MIEGKRIGLVTPNGMHILVELTKEEYNLMMKLQKEENLTTWQAYKKMVELMPDKEDGD